MANKGRGIPRAWCRDLSMPPYDGFGYLPLRLSAVLFAVADDDYGLWVYDSAISEEAEYDYDDGSVTYRFFHASDAGEVEVVARYVAGENDPWWFHSFYSVRLAGTEIRAFEFDGSEWASTGSPDINYGEYIDTEETLSWGVIITSVGCPWGSLPI